MPLEPASENYAGRHATSGDIGAACALHAIKCDDGLGLKTRATYP
jgi:hypothetical protein